jgi:hypothetical protein
MSKNVSKIVGKRFGCLLVVLRINKSRFRCRCDCGNEIEAWRTNLIQGKKKNCGCKKYEDRNETGKRYGRWTVICRYNGSVEHWECCCDCGGKGVVSRSNLISGNSQSCGCLQRERASAGGKKNRRYSWEESFQRRTRPNINIWRKSVLVKDGYKCQICETTENLVAHHKDCWMNFKEKRLDVDNGACVCKKHHILFHQMCGQGNNTSKQWCKYVQEERLSIQTRQI